MEAEPEQQLYSSVLIPDKPKRNVDTKYISVVRTMLERCKKEQSVNRLQVPLDDYVQRVSFYTGLASTYISHLEKEENDYLKEPLKVIDLIVILKCLKEEYLVQKYPTLKKTFEAAHLFRRLNNMNVIDYEQFCLQMISLKFCERPTKNGQYILMEDPKVTFERYNYLSKLVNYRSKDIPIYYLDERVIGNSLLSNGSEFINTVLFYAVLRNNGYVRGIYCTNPDKKDYMKWITDIMLTLFVPSSLIIIADGPFHKNADISITRYHSKTEMLKWLTTNNIPCSDKMNRAELYELISKCPKYKQSHIESVLKAHGHEVLFRPSSLKGCTPTESFWNDLKSELALTTANSHDPKLQDKIQTYINSVTQLQWIGYEESISKQEKIILSEDQQIQEALENYQLDTDACEKFSVGDDYRVFLATY